MTSILMRMQQCYTESQKLSTGVFLVITRIVSSWSVWRCTQPNAEYGDGMLTQVTQPETQTVVRRPIFPTPYCLLAADQAGVCVGRPAS